MSENMKEGERLNTIIGQGTVFKGECSVKGTVRVDGIIDGSLKATGVAILGKSGKIKGDLVVGNAVVGGVVEGSVIVEGRLELQSGARVEGDIKAKKLIVEEGVFFQGFCNMERKEGKQKKSAAATISGQKRESQPVRKVEEAGVDNDGEEITFRGEPI